MKYWEHFNSNYRQICHHSTTFGEAGNISEELFSHQSSTLLLCTCGQFVYRSLFHMLFHILFIVPFYNYYLYHFRGLTTSDYTSCQSEHVSLMFLTLLLTPSQDDLVNVTREDRAVLTPMPVKSSFYSPCIMTTN